MATYASQYTQSTREEATYTVDFTNDLPTGGSVTGGTAVHVPPTGSAASLTISTTSPYVYVTLPASQSTGVHYIDVTATMSDGDTPTVRIEVDVVYPSTVARSGMLNLIDELRLRASAEPNEYSIAGKQYWTDEQLQSILDRNRTDIIYDELVAVPYQAAGSLTYLEYRANYGNLEETTGGTAIFYIQEADGDTVASAGYSVDYERGIITFTTNQEGEVFYVNGRSYDIDAAAAQVWRMKASHYYTAVNFSTDNHRIDREHVYQHCLQMAEHFDGQSSSGGIGSYDLFRSDTDA